ncbi:MAG: alcohol dehydrogenase catalytic domain-containing protein [Desulfovibrio sp.]
MKAAFVKVPRKVQIREIDAPVPRAGEVLVSVDGCGVCGSDYIEASTWAKSWKRFGHEIAATVREVGEGVQGFAAGDQVALALSAPCGGCPGCLNGNPRRCTQLVVAEQGGFAELLLVKDVRLLTRIPQPLASSLAIFAEPLTVLLDALHTVGFKPGERLVVVGGGFLSCLGILTAKVLGAKPALALSRSLYPGLDACLQAVGGEHFKWHSLAGVTLAAPRSFQQRLAAATERVVVLHTAPARYLAKYIFDLPFDSTVVNIGLSGDPKDNCVSIDCSRLIFKRVQLMSAFPVPCLYLDEAVRLLCDNKDLFSLLEPERAPLERLPEIISGTRKAKRKIMVVPGSGGQGA